MRKRTPIAFLCLVVAALTACHASPAASPTPTVIVPRTPTPEPTPTIPPVPAIAGQTLGEPDANGRIWIQATVPGTVSQMTDQTLVALPKSYAADPTKRYPVVVAFPGWPAGWESYSRGQDRAYANEVKAGKIGEAIFVYPNALPRETDTECVNGAQGKNYETWLASDLVTWIRTNLPVKQDRQSWAVYGLSGGAWCAAMLAIKHPDHFGTVVSLGGYFRPIYSQGQAWRDVNDPEYDMASYLASGPKITIMYFGGADDEPSMAEVNKVRNWITTPTVWMEEIYPGHKHDDALWGVAGPNSYRVLGAKVPAFKPGT